MKILIVDDEKLIVDDLTKDLETLFPMASIDGFTEGEEALASAEHKEYDVALLDIDMPDIDGLTLARKLIVSCPVINIIFVTAYKEFALAAHDVYCSAYLLKPIGIKKLREAFSNLRKPFIDLPPGFSVSHYSGGAVIGKKLKQYREQRGISRKELADLMNVSRQTIFRWELGKRIPDVLTFLRLTRLLGVNVDDIL